MKKKVWLISLVLLVAMGFISAPAEQKAKQEVKEVHFYSVNAATGQSAPYGLKAIKAEQVLAEYINSQGGFTDKCGNRYTVKITVWDMANSREQAIAGLRKAHSDPTVLGVLGPSPATGTVPMRPVAAHIKMPMIVPTHGTHYENPNPYFFRVMADTPAVLPSVMTGLKEEVGMDSVAILSDITQDAQRAGAELIRDIADEVGYKVLAFESFREGDLDFGSQLTKIKAMNPQWLILFSTPKEGAPIVNQMHQLGIDVKLYWSFAANLMPEVWELTEGKVKGSYGWTAGGLIGEKFMDNVQTPEAFTLYKEKHGELPTIWGVLGWDALGVAIDAVKRTCSNTDREKFRDALGDTKNFPMATGGFINWNNLPNGDNMTPPFAIFEVVGKAEPKLLK